VTLLAGHHLERFEGYIQGVKYAARALRSMGATDEDVERALRDLAAQFCQASSTDGEHVCVKRAGHNDACVFVPGHLLQDMLRDA
jgi:hypothetical protein